MNFDDLGEVIHYTVNGFGIRLETKGEEDESGSTATVMLIRNDVSFIAHIGDSCAVRLVVEIFIHESFYMVMTHVLSLPNAFT